MKSLPFTVSIILLHLYALSQTTDTVHAINVDYRLPVLPFGSAAGLPVRNGASEPWWHTVRRGSVAYKSRSLLLSEYENSILDLGWRECEALQKRDGMALTILWERDFTLEEKQNRLLLSKDGLPWYATLWRMIEYITPMDSITVYASGVEVERRIGSGLQVEPVRTRNFLHVWIRRNDFWKLSAKRMY
jgi:hypothetical protein